MNLYNPFRPHIASHDGGYYVRRFSLLGWQVFDDLTEYWWTFQEFWHHGRHPDIEGARRRLLRAKSGWARIAD